jgi:hypothetical protein
MILEAGLVISQRMADPEFDVVQSRLAGLQLKSGS